MATRLGVDVGGTFTDLIAYDDDSGQVCVGKEPTTAGAPEQGVLNAVAAAVPERLLQQAEFFLHGTTVGLNALLERSGFSVGLLATRGFRDTLEIRRGDRDDPYDLFWQPPEPLVPRELRRPVTERTLADGTILVPIEEDDVRRAAKLFRAEGVSAVAVAFLHAYANPEHELRAEEALRRFGYEGGISLSHRTSGEYREYERTCTTVIDACVRPRTAGYLARLRDQLGRAGFAGRCLVTRSGGGAMTFEEAEERPFETILSGPVAGAVGAAELARSLGLAEVISADVGGTSFDTCLISNGRPQVMYQGEVVGLPVQTTWVDVRSIGAGGGSIAYVDAGGLLRVGPQSAGAEPGPVSYDKGGTEPTVTDAALLLGMLADGSLAGNITLDTTKAEAAFAPLARALGLETDEVARGVIMIAAASQADAIREITVERGRDPRRGTLMTFGGAGPLFAALLARELGIREIVVPAHAGSFSAWGLLGADLTQAAARTRIMRLDEAALADANAVLAEIFAEIVSRSGNGHGRDGSEREVGLDMRYVGQEYTLSVPVQSEAGRINASVGDILAAFDREYERTFGHTMDEEVEIVSLRGTVRTPLPRRREVVSVGGPRSGASRQLEAWSFARDEWLPFDVLDQDSLSAGDVLPGPAIILQQTATTYLDADLQARLDTSGCLFLTEREDGR